MLTALHVVVVVWRYAYFGVHLRLRIAEIAMELMEGVGKRVSDG